MCVCVCMGTWQGCESTLRGQKNTSDPLTLEIQAVVSLPNWALGKGLRSSRWVASAGKCWGISPGHSWVSCHSGCCDTHTWGCSSFWLVFLALTPRGYGTVIALPYGFFFFHLWLMFCLMEGHHFKWHVSLHGCVYSELPGSWCCIQFFHCTVNLFSEMFLLSISTKGHWICPGAATRTLGPFVHWWHSIFVTLFFCCLSIIKPEMPSQLQVCYRGHRMESHGVWLTTHHEHHIYQPDSTLPAY